MSDQIAMTPIGVVRGGRTEIFEDSVSELAPRGEVRQPEWMHELMRHYH